MACITNREGARGGEERSDDGGGKNAGGGSLDKPLVHRSDEGGLIEVVDVTPHKIAELNRDIADRSAMSGK